MIIKIDLTKADLRKLILNHVQEVLGEVKMDPNLVTIEVKSQQNYRAEWEDADFRAKYEVHR